MPIEVRNLSHIYSEGLPDESVALKDVSFAVNDGEFIGVIGHTGSGKTSLVQHLNGLLKPTKGSIWVDGKEVINSQGKRGKKDIHREEILALRKKVGLVFQYPEYQLFEESVEKDIAFGPKNLELEEEEIEQRTKEAFIRVGLDYNAIKDKSPFDFSGGQKRKIAIAGVIAMEPEILILDEPAAGLDPKAHEEIMKMARSLHGKVNRITILVSHNMNDIARYADRVMVLDKGQLVMMGTPQEVFSRDEELMSMGLDVPDAVRIRNKLTAKGFEVEKDIFEIDDLAKAVAKKLGGVGHD